MRLSPFRALRPTPAAAGRVHCVPYDTVDTAEARALAAGNADSFLHVTRPDIDLPEGADLHADAAYAQSAAALRALRERGALVREAEACLYVYEICAGAHRQRGVVAACHVEDYRQDIIRKHEKTRTEKENDRTRLMLALRAQTGPVFLTYRDSPTIDALVAAAAAGEPLFDVRAENGTEHRIWPVPGGGALTGEFARVPLSYIADGHHRAAAAARAAAELEAGNRCHTGNEPYNWMLGVLFPAGQLKVLPYNRVVADLNGRDEIAFLEALSGRVRVAEASGGEPAAGRCAHMYLGGRWRALHWEVSPADDPVSRLDVSVLQERVLAPLLGIADPRTDGRIDFVGGIRGIGELERRVDSGRAAVAFALHPVGVEAMMAIADAGQIMPPKSTWFEPKLRSGLIVYPFEA